MKHFLRYLRLRAAGPLSVASLGANESRILFDLLVSVLALAVSAMFTGVYLRGRVQLSWVASLLPAVFILSNACVGLYTRKRTASARVKSALLLSSLAIAAATLYAIRPSNAPVAVLWTMLVAGPVVFARLLLGLPYSRHRDLKAIALNPHGPVLIVGGAGYIGTHTVELLLREGRRVRVLDRLMYGIEPVSEFLRHPNFELVEGDVTDISKLTSAMRDVSAVVHLAGLVGDPACALDPELTRHTNIVATRMAKDVARSLGVQRFIFASSCSVYGVSEAPVNEAGELRPVSLYAQTKIDSERELLFSTQDDFCVTILRFATVFGHSRRPRFDLVANLFTAQAMTEGLITVIGPTQWRPFIHVRDLARSVVTTLHAQPILVQSQTFNVGDSRLNMTILQLAETVRDAAGPGRSVEITVTQDANDRRDYAVSFDKIRSALGFRAETLMKEGIGEMVEQFRAGGYGDFRSPIYSNVDTTRQLLDDFHNPAEVSKLYAPLTARV